VVEQDPELHEKLNGKLEETQLAAVGARTTCGGGGNAGTSTDRMKPPTFDGSPSWTIFHGQFEALADHNMWTSSEKVAHLLAVLYAQAADVLHVVSAGATYEYIVATLKGRYGDHHLAAVNRAQLKARIQLIGESQQTFAAAVEQLAHWALVGLPVDLIQREAAHIFIDGVRDRDVKQHLLIGRRQVA
jgi:hypothetical protein